MRKIRPGGYYRHYKNKPYKVHGVVRHSETLEELVYYESLYPNDLGRMWVRPLEMFLSDVEINGVKMPRFADDAGPTLEEIEALNRSVR